MVWDLFFFVKCFLGVNKAPDYDNYLLKRILLFVCNMTLVFNEKHCNMILLFFSSKKQFL